MATKKFEISLTPHNDEWVKLIPNPEQNMDIIFNQLIDNSIRDGSFIEVISHKLTIADLSKFKTSYSKMNTKRAEHIAALDITSTQIERTGMDTKVSEEVEELHEEDPPKKTIVKKDKKLTHGFLEESF